MLWMWTALVGCGMECGPGTVEQDGLCMPAADACPDCPACEVCKPCPKCKAAPKPPPEPVPDFPGRTDFQFNFSTNQKRIEVKAGSWFEINLGAPRNAKPRHSYVWDEPITRGRVRFSHVDKTETDKTVSYRFVFWVKDGDDGRGQIRINRVYELPTADPAPDFGVPVKVSK